VYRTVEDQFRRAKSSKDGGDVTKAGLEHRLKQLERSLQSLQRRLQPAAASASPDENQHYEIDNASSIAQSRISPIAFGTEPPTTSFQTTPSASRAQPDDSDREGYQVSDLTDPSLVSTVANTAVLEEFLLTHDQLKEILDSLPFEQADSPSSRRLPSLESEMQKSRLEMGECILANFPSKNVCAELLRAYFNGFYQIRPTVPPLWAEKALEELFQLHGLAEPRSASGVAQAAAYIDSNSEQSLHKSSKRPFLNWNVLGVLLSIFAIAAYTEPQLLDAVLPQLTAEDVWGDGIISFATKMQGITGLCWQLHNPREKPDESAALLLYFYIMVHIAFGQYSKLNQLYHFICYPS
jgi:hypothetical protein